MLFDLGDFFICSKISKMTTKDVFSDSINPVRGRVVHGKYQYISQPPQQTQLFSVSTTNQSTVTFQTTNMVWCPAESILSGSMSISLEAGKSIWININAQKLFQKGGAQSQNGNLVMDVQNLDRYMDATARRVFRKVDVDTWDNSLFESIMFNNYSGAQVMRLNNIAQAKNSESQYVMDRLQKQHSTLVSISNLISL